MKHAEIKTGNYVLIKTGYGEQPFKVTSLRGNHIIRDTDHIQVEGLGDSIHRDRVEPVEIEWTESYGGRKYLTTDLELKGRGIKPAGDGKHHKRGKRTYHVTIAAFNRLQKEYVTQYIRKWKEKKFTKL